MKRIIFLTALLCWLATQALPAADHATVHTILFRAGQHTIDPQYMDNRRTLDLMRDAFTCETLAAADSLRIIAYVSPEGLEHINAALSARRADAIARWITDRCPELDTHRIVHHAMGENYDGLRRMVEADPRVPSRQAVLHIIDTPMNADRREKQLRALDGGAPFAYLSRHYFARLRTGSLTMIDPHTHARPIIVTPAPAPAPELDQAATPATVEDAQQSSHVVAPAAPTAPNTHRLVRPIALKTNMLFDLATLLNVEVEVPVAPHWSIAGEWIFPWWLSNSKQNCLQIHQGTLEARYWLRPNFKKQDPQLSTHNPLTGWFVGAYGSVGYYDLEWDHKGYHSDLFYNTGLTAGYALPLRRNLSLEFSLGIGYLRTDYREYNAQWNSTTDQFDLVRQQDGTTTWIGPTRAKVSLVWYPHIKLHKKGGNNQ